MDLSYHVLRARQCDFAAKFMAVSDLHCLAQDSPQTINSEMISTLEFVLRDSTPSRQTQCLFLYKQAAEALGSIVLRTIGGHLASKAVSVLMDVLGATEGSQRRAAAEALGSLPVSICGPKIGEQITEDIPSVKWQEVLEKTGVRSTSSPARFGRSLVVPFKRNNGLLVFKLAYAKSSVEPLHREAVWMDHLCSGGYSFPVRFNIPAAIKTKGSYVFKLQDMPASAFCSLDIHPEQYAIGFIVHKDYFAYPNEHRPEKRLSAGLFKEVMLRNAWLLGKLTSLGIVHSAPIPLFHNRVQGNRRSDNGVYEWWRGGRLDRWLYSCWYPNFGLTGMRDLEHLIVFEGPNLALFRHIGSHILSLLLVTASYFRNKDAQKVGLRGQTVPVDARDLFDKRLFEEVITGIFHRYYHGFVGEEFTGNKPVDFDELASRMIDEMGVDRHMEEVFRAADQKRLTDNEFRGFLKNRGYSHSQIRAHRKGVEDIVIYTGPHLGGFNERISLPELIEALRSMAALCVLGRFLGEKASGHSLLG